MANRYLLDTQHYLWWLNEDPKLKDSVKNIIADSSNLIFASIANLWEISIKSQKGKLPMKTTLKQIIKATEFSFFDVNAEHILALNKLPPYHNDPFDRIVISQAIVENCTIISSDNKFKKYKVPVIGF